MIHLSAYHIVNLKLWSGSKKVDPLIKQKDDK